MEILRWAQSPVSVWNIFVHRVTLRSSFEVLSLPCANPLCILQLFRSVEKPEGAHGPWEWVSSQGAASAQCHPCQSTERPRQHRQACHQHKQDRGGDVRGWRWVIRNMAALFWMQHLAISLVHKQGTRYILVLYQISLGYCFYLQCHCWFCFRFIVALHLLNIYKCNKYNRLIAIKLCDSCIQLFAPTYICSCWY